MDLYILRHGKAEPHTTTIAGDAKRKLTPSGKKEMEEIAEAINAMGIKCDYIITSPLVRAQQTASIVSSKLKSKNKQQLEWDELKPEGDRKKLYKKLSKLGENSSVLLVGHEPSLSTIMGEIITNGDATSNIVLKKAGMAKVRILRKHPKFYGELRWLFPPKKLKNFNK